MTGNDFRKDFPIIENNNITYLDSGATTQKPKQVIDALKHYYEFDNANPHRGVDKKLLNLLMQKIAMKLCLQEMLQKV